MPTSPADTLQMGADGIENIKLLMQYTIFHIGLYITLFTAIVTAVEKRIFSQRAASGLRVAALCLVIAGAAGGVIGSSLPDARSFSSFRRLGLKPTWWPGGGLQYSTWAEIEHIAFWCAIACVVVTLVLPECLAALRNAGRALDRKWKTFRWRFRKRGAAY